MGSGLVRHRWGGKSELCTDSATGYCPYDLGWRGYTRQGFAGAQRRKFITGGKPPELRQIVSSDQHAGRTCYIGSREGAKFLRCYEKGFEVYQKMIAAYGFSPEGVKLDGKNLADIYRVELELKPDRCVIPWETIDQRDQYFAGAYPFNAELLPEVEPDVLLRDPKKAPQRELQALLGVIRQQYGKASIRPARPSRVTLARSGIRLSVMSTIPDSWKLAS